MSCGQILLGPVPTIPAYIFTCQRGILPTVALAVCTQIHGILSSREVEAGAGTILSCDGMYQAFDTGGQMTQECMAATRRKQHLQSNSQ